MIRRRDDRELAEMRKNVKFWRECAARCLAAGDPDRSAREYQIAEQTEAEIRTELALRAGSR